jgi:ABC-type transport system involved in multi-copper enzyme maturation permease subunit
MSALAADPVLTEPRVPLLRLARVELRKTYDTRAGFWLLATIALLGVGIVLATTFGADAADRTFVDYLYNVGWPINLLLPVLGVLLITSEWSQRTALTSFTLVPERTRVIAAKLVALAILTVGAVGVSMLAAAIGTLVGGDAGWSFSGTALGEVFVFQLTAMLIGFAFGLVFLSSPLAIVLYFVLPVAWSIIVGVIPGLDDVADWLDLGQTTVPLNQGDVSATEWARLAASLGLWLVVPLALGLWRLRRAELK